MLDKRRTYKLTFTSELIAHYYPDERTFTEFYERYSEFLPEEEREGMRMIAANPRILSFPRQVMKLSDDSMIAIATIMARQIKGFFKEASIAFQRMPSMRDLAKHYTARLKYVVFVEPENIPLEVPSDRSITVRTRYVRTFHNNRPRMAEITAEYAPVGTSATFTVRSETSSWEWLEACLNYGEFRGMGGWRDAGFGRFIWKRIE